MSDFITNNVTILHGDVQRRLAELPDESVHCCVTSPPYWSLRDYQVDGQIGLEKTPEAYIAKLVEVFRDVRRVLRSDGTLWLNIGDSYNAGTFGARKPTQTGKHGYWENAAINQRATSDDTKPKDMFGIPWMLAFALRADGWYLRQDIIWHKPAPMPESVTDRCTKAHEYLFLLTKSPKYFYDAYAIREPSSPHTNSRGTNRRSPKTEPDRSGGVKNNQSFQDAMGDLDPDSGRNRRSVWKINTEPSKAEHYAAFPTKLVEVCLRAGTSERGCCDTCAAPWQRIVERSRVATRPGHGSKVWEDAADSPYTQQHGTIIGNRDPYRHQTSYATTGWKPTCDCGSLENQARSVVLDPFLGTGTTAAVACEMGYRAIGIELSEKYIAIAAQRFQQGMLC